MAKTSGVLDGTIWGLYSGANLLGLGTSCSLSLNTDLRDISNKDTAGWKKVLAGQKTWTMSGEHLAAFSETYNYTYLLNLQLNGTALTLAMKTNVATNWYMSGTAYITSIQVSAPNAQNTTFSIQFQGDGALTLTDPEV